MLQDDAARAEAAALAVKGISQVQAASAGYGRRYVHLAASNGFSGGYGRTDRALSCVAITGSGTAMERDYFGDMRIHQSDLMSPEEIGRIAAERTVERAGSRKPPTGAFPVVYDERISSALIGHLIQAINGTAIARGASWLRDALGEQVLPKGISLIEDPHCAPAPPARGPLMPRVWRRAPATLWPTAFSPAGRLIWQPRASWGWTAPANAARGPSSPPSPSVGNVTLTQGAQSREELLADMGTGLLITSMIGSSINANYRRLFARGLGILGRERRDHLSGERMHRRGQSA